MSGAEAIAAAEAALYDTMIVRDLTALKALLAADLA